MLSQYSAPLLEANPVEYQRERDAMTQERAVLRREMDEMKRVIDDCDTVDEDGEPRPPAVVRGEKMQ
jgi:chaperonin cofactor prefoldin